MTALESNKTRIKCRHFLWLGKWNAYTKWSAKQAGEKNSIMYVRLNFVVSKW